MMGWYSSPMTHCFKASSLALAVAALSSAPAFAQQQPSRFSGSQYESLARVTLAQARAVALKAVPHGKIVDQELEKENGGSGLRYSFDVKVGNNTREVGVDAKTGKVLENSLEGANSD